MSKPNFTPGPWTIKSLGMRLYIKSGDNTVAEVFETYQIDFRQKIANARLIAAAPKMLAALEKIMETELAIAQEYRVQAEDSENYCIADEVVRQARGESVVEK